MKFLRRFSRKGSRKGVSFTSTPPEVFHQVPLEVSLHEIWYDKRESRQIRAENHQLIRQPPTSTEEDDMRGLEALDRAGKELRLDHRLEAMAVVLTKQEVQSIRGMADPDDIACAYRDASQVASKYARSMAIQDELYVLQSV